MMRAQRTPVVVSAIALVAVALGACGSDEPAASDGTSNTSQPAEGSSMPVTPLSTTTSAERSTPDSSADGVGEWAEPFCDASVELLVAWHDLDDESDWLLIANRVDDTVSQYRASLDAIGPPPSDDPDWSGFVADIDEQDAAIQHALEQVQAMDVDAYEDDPTLHPAADAILRTYNSIGSFMQQPPLSLGTSLNGVDGQDESANGVPACDELAAVWFRGVDG